MRVLQGGKVHLEYRIFCGIRGKYSAQRGGGGGWHDLWRRDWDVGGKGAWGNHLQRSMSRKRIEENRLIMTWGFFFLLETKTFGVSSPENPQVSPWFSFSSFDRSTDFIPFFCIFFWSHEKILFVLTNPKSGKNAALLCHKNGSVTHKRSLSRQKIGLF